MTRPPPRELPGFYYDPEKNRYFPIRGPIPGAAARRGPAPPPATTPPSAADPAGFSSRKRARRQELLSAREMYGGGVILSNRSTSNSTFKQQYQYAQASQPTVWKYQGTALVADMALEQLHATVQTPEGIRGSRILVTGSMNGSIRLYGLDSSLHNYLGNELEFLPQPAWTPLEKQKNSALPSIWSSKQAFANFSSGITCVKKIGPHSSDAASTSSSAQQAFLVALSSDENYFLGSSMDGSIKLFDLRFTKNFFDLRIIKKPGIQCIQSYEGHVNSHTHLPLVIDPSETLVMSGGEDCAVRIWSIKTGELIFAERVADNPLTALCWPESSREMCSSLLFDENHSWGAWLGSRDGLFYMHGT